MFNNYNDIFLPRAKSSQLVLVICLQTFIILISIHKFTVLKQENWIHNDFLVAGYGHAQNSSKHGCYRGGTESTISVLSGSCVSFLCSAGRSSGLPSSKQTPRMRPLPGESWGLLGYDHEETSRKWADALMPLNAKLPKRLACQCGKSVFKGPENTDYTIYDSKSTFVLSSGNSSLLFFITQL